MEFVGKTLKKEFKGLGVVSATVRSYDSSTGLFEIVAEDGRLEELEFSEVASLVMEGRETAAAAEGEQPVQVKPRVGRKPKKRRRVERKRESPGNSGNEVVQENNGLVVSTHGNFGMNVDSNYGLVENFGGNDRVDLNRGFQQTQGMEREPSSRDLNGNVTSLRNDIDLNAGLNLNLNDGVDSGDWVNVNVDYEEGFRNKRRDYIDLNLDVNCDVDEVGGSILDCKKEYGFDLNLEVEEDVNKDEGPVKSNSASLVEEIGKQDRTYVKDGIANGELKEVNVAGVSCLGLVQEIKKENGISGKDNHVHDCDGVQLKDGLSESATKVIDGSQSNMGNSDEPGNGRRKRRKILDKSTVLAGQALRRSSRRMSSTNHTVSTITSYIANDLSTSPAVSGVTEEKTVIPAQDGAEEPVVLPLKLQLPPSSKHLNLDGIPILDVFSIYACLRSFSTLLFLSPFELEDFVAALRCQYPSSLIDSIHVALLQTLRKDLELLSNEGYQSATDCLRSLNWDFLDPITWPLFMVEYLLIHGSGLRADFDLGRLKIFQNDYYKQPAVLKVEMLRCLCDDMIEVEAIRSELNRRSLELEMDFDRNGNIEYSKKRRNITYISGFSSLTNEVIDDVSDWNSDECCLCKMDGNLLCCDGCPAAYHSKCVGVSSHLLPEGDWYCPECAFDRHKSWMKPLKLRGAEILGIDPHGRQYFSSCGYLLVIDTCDVQSSFNYYHKNDLNGVLAVLKTSDVLYGGITKAIYRQWDIPVGSNRAANTLNSHYSVSTDAILKEQIPGIAKTPAPLTSSGVGSVKNEAVDDGKVEGKFVLGSSAHLLFGVSKPMNPSDPATSTEVPYLSSEGSAETTQAGPHDHNFLKQAHGTYGMPVDFLNHSEAPNLGDCFLISSSLDMGQGSSYINCYSFAWITSLIGVDLMGKSSDKPKQTSMKTEEEIISIQMKAILKRSKRLSFPNIWNENEDAVMEKCGWCFSCKGPDDHADCLFNMCMGLVRELPESERAELQSKRNKKGHLIDAICHILSIESRLHGLLLGPWLTPNYSKLWRKSVVKASSVSCLKHLLLTLEANLHRLALSAEWLKHVDSFVTMGSASHVVVTSLRASSRNGVGRKRGRLSDSENNHTSNAGGGLSMCWWRGGRLSRQLFSWKTVPSSLASKAARQAGCVKIPGIFYPESSDFPKRSRYVAWRAAVESSSSVEQLAFQVRELDSHIKWDDIENSHPLSVLDKEARKSIRLFKKAIIRRKCLEGNGVKYLLDFGKRRVIPDIVLRNGSIIEESSSERKKYWLSESYVPLHLMRSFEDKRVTRKSVKISSVKLSESGGPMKNFSKKRGFSYLFSRAERSENYKCGHCNRAVPIREAVCCQYCEGFFHKRHVRKSAGAIVSECTYTCHRCENRKLVKIRKNIGNSDGRGKRGRKSLKNQPLKQKKVATACRSVRLKNSKKPLVGVRSLRPRKNKKVAATLPLRRSARRAQYISKEENIRKPGGHKKRGRKPKKFSEKQKKSVSCQKKRTLVYHSYWLNGLLLSRKPDDERVIKFRKEKYFAPSQNSNGFRDQPKCSICQEAGSSSGFSYISCEICGEWFHGDAYGLNAEITHKLIGFRCHVCRKRSPPVCPHCTEDHRSLSPVEESTDKNGLKDVVLDKNRGLVSQLELEVENGELLTNEKRSADALKVSNKDLQSDINLQSEILTSNKNFMLEDKVIS